MTGGKLNKHNGSEVASLTHSSQTDPLGTLSHSSLAQCGAAQTGAALVRRSQRHSERCRAATRTHDEIRPSWKMWESVRSLLCGPWPSELSAWRSEGSAGRAITELELSVCLCDKHARGRQRRENATARSDLLPPPALCAHK